MLKEILREIVLATSRDNFTRFFHAYFQHFFNFCFTFFENYFLHFFVHCGKLGILIINDKQFINHSFELFVISVINNLSLKKLFVSTKQLIQHQELIFFSEIKETTWSTTTVPKTNRIRAGERSTIGQKITQRRKTRVSAKTQLRNS